MVTTTTNIVVSPRNNEDTQQAPPPNYTTSDYPKGTAATMNGTRPQSHNDTGATTKTTTENLLLFTNLCSLTKKFKDHMSLKLEEDRAALKRTRLEIARLPPNLTEEEEALTKEALDSGVPYNQKFGVASLENAAQVESIFVEQLLVESKNLVRIKCQQRGGPQTSSNYLNSSSKPSPPMGGFRGPGAPGGPRAAYGWVPSQGAAPGAGEFKFRKGPHQKAGGTEEDSVKVRSGGVNKKEVGEKWVENFSKFSTIDSGAASTSNDLICKEGTVTITLLGAPQHLWLRFQALNPSYGDSSNIKHDFNNSHHSSPATSSSKGLRSSSSRSSSRSTMMYDVFASTRDLNQKLGAKLGVADPLGIFFGSSSTPGPLKKKSGSCTSTNFVSEINSNQFFERPKLTRDVQSALGFFISQLLEFDEKGILHLNTNLANSANFAPLLDFCCADYLVDSSASTNISATEKNSRGKLEFCLNYKFHLVNGECIGFRVLMQ